MYNLSGITPPANFDLALRRRPTNLVPIHCESLQDFGVGLKDMFQFDDSEGITSIVTDVRLLKKVKKKQRSFLSFIFFLSGLWFVNVYLCFLTSKEVTWEAFSSAAWCSDGPQTSKRCLQVWKRYLTVQLCFL